LKELVEEEAEENRKYAIEDVFEDAYESGDSSSSSSEDDGDREKRAVAMHESSLDVSRSRDKKQSLKSKRSKR